MIFVLREISTSNFRRRKVKGGLDFLHHSVFENPTNLANSLINLE